MAFWDGGCIRRLSTEGDVIEMVKMPVQRPTCPVIVGDKIYVTSASIGLDEASNRLAGGLFELTLTKKVCSDKSVYYFR